MYKLTGSSSQWKTTRLIEVQHFFLFHYSIFTHPSSQRWLLNFVLHSIEHNWQYLADSNRRRQLWDKQEHNKQYAITLYVSTGMSDTWSNQITPFLVVVNWSLEFVFDPLASSWSSTFVQFDNSKVAGLQEEIKLILISIRINKVVLSKWSSKMF